MSKFKVGDKVALKSSPCVKLGVIDSDVFGYYLIDIGNDSYKMVDGDDIVLIEEMPNLSDDEIYNMLKPKMKNDNVWNHGYRAVAYDDGYHLVREDSDVIKSIALAYRSGYLRAKKGRPFKIGGEKD